ncbi:PepSY-like domain-containing protein [Frigoriflavimonas asaccharolytica]|uniref:Putative membrane protein YkoI n=1 Tax=Frigoriflavimonas asaccharolytica TaxID=2735899 RepID=A0A8J8GB80_9FLAO|nr:PepSY-like domain-containing protein [Frigoriflavimonas asaccharolytica]NRS94025.1 putative membrane protein YkoI [Frigoriflavimonas asaccharolytica]
MKKSAIVLSIIFALGAGTVTAQQMSKKDEVPVAVKNAFKKDYPQVKKVKWDDEHGTYEAEFKMGNKDMSVTYSKSGMKEETETSLKVTELPKSVISYVAQKKYGKIKEAARIVKADGSVVYEAEVKSGDLLFNENGSFNSLKIEKD